MAELTVAEKVSRFDKIQAKARIAKLEGKVLKLRALEVGTTAALSMVLGGVAAWKPDSDGWLYGIASPKAISVTLGTLGFVFSGKSDAMREAGAAAVFAGGVPLMHKLGAYLYEKITT